MGSSLRGSSPRRPNEFFLSPPSSLPLSALYFHEGPLSSFSFSFLGAWSCRHVCVNTVSAARMRQSSHPYQSPIAIPSSFFFFLGLGIHCPPKGGNKREAWRWRDHRCFLSHREACAAEITIRCYPSCWFSPLAAEAHFPLAPHQPHAAPPPLLSRRASTAHPGSRLSPHPRAAHAARGGGRCSSQ